MVRAAAARVSKSIGFDRSGKRKKKKNIRKKKYTANNNSTLCTVCRYTYIRRGEFLITAPGMDFD